MQKKEKDPSRVKAGRAARMRGQRAEREVCDILTRITGDKHTRNLEQTRDGGHDIECGPFMLEVKYQQRVKVSEWLEQIEAAANKRGKLPMLVFRRNAERWKAVVDFEVLMQIVQGLRGGAPEADNGIDADSERVSGTERPVRDEAQTGS